MILGSHLFALNMLYFFESFILQIKLFCLIMEDDLPKICVEEPPVICNANNNIPTY